MALLQALLASPYLSKFTGSEFRSTLTTNDSNQALLSASCRTWVFR